MFDYKLLAALAAVVEQAGFERAAQALGLSQSAISQRIKLLEARVGQPVLLRDTPPRPTELGQRLLNHVQQVRLLERDLQGQVPALDENRLPERLRIALNADTLATWWAGAVAPFCAENRVLLSITWWKIRRSGSSACAQGGCGLRLRCGATGGGRAQPVSGDALSRPGQPGVHRATFPAGRACGGPGACSCRGVRPGRPAAASLHGGGRRREILLHHLCPSSEGFVRLLRSGLGWGLAPELQVRGELARGELVDVLSGRRSTCRCTGTTGVTADSCSTS